MIFVRLQISQRASFGKCVKCVALQMCSRVLGIVSLALLDDPDSLSTNRCVNGFSQRGRSYSWSPKAVGARSPDAAAASLQRTCVDNTSKYDCRYTVSVLLLMILSLSGGCFFFHSLEHPFCTRILSPARARQVSLAKTGRQ